MIFRKKNRPFKVRSGERNREVDIIRLNTIHSIFDEIIRQINFELMGLNRRYRDEADLAANAMGNSDITTSERESVEEAAILRAESEMHKAMMRIRELRLQIAHIATMQDLLARWPSCNEPVNDPREVTAAADTAS